MIRCEHLRHAEVGQLHDTVFPNDQIRRLQITVNGSGIVCGLQRGTDLNGNSDRLAPFDTARFLNFFGQSHTVDVLHGVIIRLIVLTPFEEFDHVRILQFSQRIDLPLKPCDKPLFPR